MVLADVIVQFLLGDPLCGEAVWYFEVPPSPPRDSPPTPGKSLESSHINWLCKDMDIFRSVYNHNSHDYLYKCGSKMRYLKPELYYVKKNHG
jgi:hypothetical protein